MEKKLKQKTENLRINDNGSNWETVKLPRYTYAHINSKIVLR